MGMADAEGEEGLVDDGLVDNEEEEGQATILTTGNGKEMYVPVACSRMHGIDELSHLAEIVGVTHNDTSAGKPVTVVMDCMPRHELSPSNVNH